MSDNPRENSVGTAVLSAIIAVAAAGALWQAREFSAFGSIFPIFVGSALLAGSLLVLVRTLGARGRSADGLTAANAPASDRPAEAPGEHRMINSVALIAVLVGWVTALEWIGFFASSWIGFVALALIATGERPTFRHGLVYGATALAVVGGLQLLFQYGLKVRLPAGELVTRLLG